MVDEPQKQKVAAVYDTAADHFDAGALGFWSRYGRRTVERLSPRPGWRVLDVSCGSGASAIPAAQAAGPDGHVLGVDLAERLLARARAKAEQLDIRNVEFRRGDMASLEFPDGHFDAVICVFAIFFVPDMAEQVKKLRRLLRPGGRLAITTWGPCMFEPGSTAWWTAVKRVRSDLHVSVNPWDRLTSADALRQLLADGGVTNAEVVVEAGTQHLRSAADWWDIVLGSGYRGVIEQMDRREAALVREENLKTLHEIGADAVETNVIYALASKENA
jgi:ubiquinone/menaquinone biosynthesis C-methylase UbiE